MLVAKARTKMPEALTSVPEELQDAWPVVHCTLLS